MYPQTLRQCLLLCKNIFRHNSLFRPVHLGWPMKFLCRHATLGELASNFTKKKWWNPNYWHRIHKSLFVVTIGPLEPSPHLIYIIPFQILSSHLCLIFLSGVFLSCFQPKVLYYFHISLTVLHITSFSSTRNLIALKIKGEKRKLLVRRMCKFWLFHQA